MLPNLELESLAFCREISCCKQELWIACCCNFPRICFARSTALSLSHEKSCNETLIYHCCVYWDLKSPPLWSRTGSQCNALIHPFPLSTQQHFHRHTIKAWEPCPKPLRRCCQAVGNTWANALGRFQLIFQALDGAPRSCQFIPQFLGL